MCVCIYIYIYIYIHIYIYLFIYLFIFNLREFGCKLPSSLPSCVRESRSGSGVGVERSAGVWGPSRSMVFIEL